ncbi:ABC transporter ATP-binding protein [Eubacterium oxidoreducens]|uniref:ABC-2 type transport system ATP-binding protein n=1 Tax=Eubacterium oxidoreducens TaxID=1732 RepID=A0A1G6BNS4_EUBOX|nr:ABC transporter ATP-binding protein [Eubacterium oxidoreducens]SDB22264.1 ABC-2 type transport system ATP-binding protein [Eubacterium oxidoreducens]
MIDIEHISKHFDSHCVLKDISISIPSGCIYGLIGYNGAGKTTLLKIIAGIYRSDEGHVLVNGEKIYENELAKRQLFLMTEELYFFKQASLLDAQKFYRGYYPNWNSDIFQKLVSLFELDPKERILEFSKGMQRQAALALAFASMPKYLLLDEAFDGLDLGIRKTMRKLLFTYVKQTDATVILTSHNLSELEECADRFGMLNASSLICDMDVDEITKNGSSLEEYFLDERKQPNYEVDHIFS